MTKPSLRSALLRAMLLPLLSSAALQAQCPYQSATLQRYGSGCSEVFGFAPTLSANLDIANCSLDLLVDVYGGCCNTFLQGTLLLLGLQPAALPLQLLDPTCTLLAQPDLVLLQSGPIPDLFSLPIPPGLPPLTLYAQGAGSYITTVWFPLPLLPQFSLTPGYAISLQ